MYCSNCGAEIKNEKAKFCGACGAPIKSPQENVKINQNSDGKARGILQTKRIAIGGCVVVALVVLFLVGGDLVKNVGRNTNGSSFLSREAVRVSNLSVRPITIYGDNDNIDYKSSEGTVIEASIKNKSKESLDVELVVEATVEYEDKYKDKQMAHVQLYVPSSNTSVDGFHCPYSRHFCSFDGLPAVGLAPKEEKTVRYYFEENNIISGYDMDDNNREVEIRNGTITDVKQIAINYEKSDYVYVAASEWEDQVKIEQKDESLGILHQIRECLTGEIVNNTKNRWERAELFMDVQVDGQGYYETIGADQSYIGVGKSFTFEHVSFIEPLKSNFLIYNKDGHKIEYLPALMYYIPETN